MPYVWLRGLSWLLLAVSLLTLASAQVRVRHRDCKQCDWAFAFAQSMCLQPTNMSTLHTHVLCVIVVAIAQGVLLAGVSLHHAAWEVCMRVCVCAGSAIADARYLASSQESDEELQSLLSYEEVCQKAIPDLKVNQHMLCHDSTCSDRRQSLFAGLSRLTVKLTSRFSHIDHCIIVS